MSVVFRAALVMVCAGAAFGQTAPPLIAILADELDRNFRILKEKGDPAPYYIAYEVTERDSSAVSATLGALKSTRKDRSRVLDITVRVGSPKRDNYHRIRGDGAHFTAAVPIPLEDNAAAIRRLVWLETDRVYRSAAERLIRIKTNQDVSVADEDDSDDFSKEEPSTFFSLPPVRAFPPDMAARARKLSLAFAKFPPVLTSRVTISGQREVRYFVNTEGARIAHGRNSANINLIAQSKASDGMDLFAMETVDAAGAASLPNDDAVIKAAQKVGKLAVDLPLAPVVEPYVGPAVLSGRAAAVLFHEIFGHRIEGHRQKDETEGQTFTKMAGTKVLPDFLSVVFDPTQHDAAGIPLNGWYDFDDEGVKAQRIVAVENGVLKTFLMSRSPVRGFAHSNGHGRRQPGLEVVSRQSNLFVEASSTMPDTELREMLLAEVRKQNKPYGLYFDQVTGGFTTTQRRGPQAFQVIPLVVYKVYADGRKDELVRGADIVGTPLASFAKIAAAGNRPEVFNGYCGAESGSVPVAAVSPAILISEIEIQKKPKANDRPPLLPSPPGGGQQ